MFERTFEIIYKLQITNYKTQITNYILQISEMIWTQIITVPFSFGTNKIRTKLDITIFNNAHTMTAINSDTQKTFKNLEK